MGRVLAGISTQQQGEGGVGILGLKGFHEQFSYVLLFFLWFPLWRIVTELQPQQKLQ